MITLVQAVWKFWTAIQSSLTHVIGFSLLSDRTGSNPWGKWNWLSLERLLLPCCLSVYQNVWCVFSRRQLCPRWLLEKGIGEWLVVGGYHFIHRPPPSLYASAVPVRGWGHPMKDLSRSPIIPERENEKLPLTGMLHSSHSLCPCLHSLSFAINN